MGREEHGRQGEALVGRSSNTLAREMKAYQSKRRQLLEKNIGRWVIIKGDHVVGCYSTEEAAVAAGRKEGPPFLAHQIVRREPVYQIPTFDVSDD